MRPPSHRRPLGVAVLAVLIALLGAFFLFVAILVLLAIGIGLLGSIAAFGASTIGGIVLLVLAIVFLVVAKGLWDQELWALVLSLIVLVLILVGDVLRGTFGLDGLLVVGLIVYLVAVHRHFT